MRRYGRVRSGALQRLRSFSWVSLALALLPALAVPGEAGADSAPPWYSALEARWDAASRSWVSSEAPASGLSSRAQRASASLAETALASGGFRVELARRELAAEFPQQQLVPRAGTSRARFELVSLDGPGEGLSDATPWQPWGGNTATTLGAARRRVLELALGLYSEALTSAVPIRVGVEFGHFGGDELSATLGFGGPESLYRDFAGAPLGATWYPSALADKLAGVDLGGAGSLDLLLSFNADVDGPEVFGSLGFDYGLSDHPAVGAPSFLRVALHELLHGLGFGTYVDGATGALLSGRGDVLLSHLVRRGATPTALSAMSDSERQAALAASGEIYFAGTATEAAAGGLTAGRSPEGWVAWDTLSGTDAGSLSHFASALEPDQLEEPFYSDGARVASASGLARAVLADLGWGAAPACAAPPAAVPFLDERFDDGDFAGWTVRDVGTTHGPSVWAVSGGVLQQTSDIDGDALGRGTLLTWDGGASWRDYRLRVQLRSLDDDEVGVVFRYQDPTHFYRFDWDRQGSERRLVKVVDGVLTVLAGDTTYYTMDEAYWLDLEAVGPQLTVKIDGWLWATATDSSLDHGTVGLSSFSNNRTYFDLVKVGPPAAATTVLMEDDFQDKNTTGWTVVNVGTLSGPSVWTAANQFLKQSSNIYGDPLLRGAWLYWAAGFSWQNVELSARIWSGDDDYISLLFRYQDKNNFYRFEWDKQTSHRRLVKVVGGVLTELAADSVPYHTFEVYWVEARARGDQLSITIDGADIFSVRDGDLISGTVALGTYDNNSTNFDNVRVEVAP